MSTSAARIQANHANSQLSTGPRTPEGKLRSSTNALRHGLTSKMVLLPGDDLDAYNDSKRRFFEELKPQGELEQQLAYTLVNTQWRLNRCRSFEESILAVETAGVDDTPIPAETAAAGPEPHARLIESQVESLARLGLYESRLTRIFLTTLKQFRELQSERREHEQQAMAEAAKVMKLHQTQQIPFNPAELGFVFSISEIQDWRSRQERIQAARDLAAREFNTRFFARTGNGAIAERRE